MDWLNFITTIFESATENLAWPVVIGVILYRFSPQIIALFEKLRSFRGAGMEMDFDLTRELERAERQLESSGISDGRLEYDPQFAGRINDWWQDIEVALRAVVAEKEGPSLLDEPFWSLMIRAHNAGLINSKTFSLLRILGRIKTRLESSQVEVTEDNYKSFARMAGMTLDGLKAGSPPEGGHN